MTPGAAGSDEEMVMEGMEGMKDFNMPLLLGSFEPNSHIAGDVKT